MLNRGAGRRAVSVRISPVEAAGLRGSEEPGCRHGKSGRLSPRMAWDKSMLMPPLACLQGRPLG